MEKTDSQLPLMRLNEDHLHIRGENSANYLGVSTTTGSPPHTWRKLVVVLVALVVLGITSTYVEKTTLAMN